MGQRQAYRIKHANILLAVDAGGPNWPDHQVAKAYMSVIKTRLSMFVNVLF
jgi:hypothetical protein